MAYYEKEALIDLVLRYGRIPKDAELPGIRNIKVRKQRLKEKDVCGEDHP